MQSDKVLNLPAGYFGIVLGTIGMGFAWRYASQVWQVSHWLGDGLVILAMIIWGLLTSAFIARLIRFPQRAGGSSPSSAEQFCEFVSGNDDAGGDWFCSVVSPTGGACSVLVSWFSWLMPPGKLRDYGADLTLKKLPRLDCICRQLPTTLSAQWPVVRWATPTPVWCFRRRRFLMAKP